MTFLKMTKARYSVRKFTEQAVEKEKIDKILTAANNAPTAHNNQPQKIFVMQSPEALAMIDQCTRGRFGAPLVLVIAYDQNQSWKRKDGYDSGEVDVGIIGTHVMFEALEQGLGSCWVVNFHDDILKDSLQLPDDIIPVALISIGYIAADSVPSLSHEQRKELPETVQFK
ncbi:MAG TPA: nitroreductase [Acholeplasmatales bacterium]|nr:nitroreductase [Acholeplasmatales bacterium]